MLRSLEPLEQKFREVEEELERRAFTEQSMHSTPEPELIDPTPGPSRRRKGSVSISRFGQPRDFENNMKSHPAPPSSLAAAALRSSFYHSLSNPRSMESLISEASEDEESQVEDEHHVTQMQKIAGRQNLGRSLSKTMGSMLSRRISRSQSENVLATGRTNLVIDVSVEEVTDATHSTAFVTSGTTALRPRSSTITVPNHTSKHNGSNWVSKAKKLTQRIGRRKSSNGLPGDGP